MHFYTMILGATMTLNNNMVAEIIHMVCMNVT